LRRKALGYMRRSAALARGASDAASAAALHDQAIELGALDGLQSGEHYELLIGAGDAWQLAGEAERAGERFERAAQVALGEGDSARAAKALVGVLNASRASAFELTA